MILGLTIAQFVALHVVISLVGIAAGLVALPAFAAGRFLPRTTALFMVMTALTTLTGFLFPIVAFTPALATGFVSTLVLIVAFAALYAFRLQGRARPVYAVSATIAQYLNMFVLIVQSFLKIPALNALAPNGNEPAFVAAQGTLLIGAIAFGYIAYKEARRPARVVA